MKGSLSYLRKATFSCKSNYLVQGSIWLILKWNSWHWTLVLAFWIWLQICLWDLYQSSDMEGRVPQFDLCPYDPKQQFAWGVGGCTVMLKGEQELPIWDYQWLDFRWECNLLSNQPYIDTSQSYQLEHPMFAFPHVICSPKSRLFFLSF